MGRTIPASVESGTQLRFSYTGHVSYLGTGILESHAQLPFRSSCGLWTSLSALGWGLGCSGMGGGGELTEGTPSESISNSDFSTLQTVPCRSAAPFAAPFMEGLRVSPFPPPPNTLHPGHLVFFAAQRTLSQVYVFPSSIQCSSPTQTSSLKLTPGWVLPLIFSAQFSLHGGTSDLAGKLSWCLSCSLLHCVL